MTMSALTLTEPDLEILDEATRRQFLTMLVAAGLLAACGDDGDGDARKDAGVSAGYPRTIRDAVGNDVTLARKPERVVSIFEHVVLALPAAGRSWDPARAGPAVLDHGSAVGFRPSSSTCSSLRSNVTPPPSRS